MTRRGTSLIEILVAVAVLAVATAAMMNLLTGESRLTRFSLERFVALQALGEMEGAFAGRPAAWFAARSFPADEANWNPLLDTLVDEDPVVTPREPLARTLTVTQAELREAYDRIDVRRRVLYRPGDPSDPEDPPRIELVVRYRPPGGTPRDIRALRVLR